MSNNKEIHPGPFGTCCDSLSSVMQMEYQPTYVVDEENQILFQAIGYLMDEEGPAFFEQAVIYCSFCGTKLQDEEEVMEKMSKLTYEDEEEDEEA